MATTTNRERLVTIRSPLSPRATRMKLRSRASDPLVGLKWPIGDSVRYAFSAEVVVPPSGIRQRPAARTLTGGGHLGVGRSIGGRRRAGYAKWEAGKAEGLSCDVVSRPELPETVLVDDLRHSRSRRGWRGSVQGAFGTPRPIVVLKIASAYDLRNQDTRTAC